MEQVQFIEYKVKNGIGDLLFVNMHNVKQYRFYRRRKNWNECYMVEFCSDSNDYNLYWGRNESERCMIDVTELLFPPYPDAEWKQVKFEQSLAYNLSLIIGCVDKIIGNPTLVKHNKEME